MPLSVVLRGVISLLASIRGTAKISLKPAVGSVSPGQRGVPVNRAGAPTWVVESFREDSFSEANPALTSENPKLSAERPGQRLQRTGSPSGGQTRRRGRARASTHGEAGPLWVSCLSWPYPMMFCSRVRSALSGTCSSTDRHTSRHASGELMTLVPLALPRHCALG